MKKSLILKLILAPFLLIANPISISDLSTYLQACQKAATSDQCFEHFKRDPDYQAILEHVTEAQGHDYLYLIKNNYPHLYKKISDFKINDYLGDPNLYLYSRIGRISPTTLRYIKVAGDLGAIFGSLNDISVVEIGAGYGGQALILNTIYKIKNYHIFDLFQPLLLQKKYLGAHKINNVMFHDGRMCDSVKDYDLLISNYAFSECVKEIQSLYLKNIIQYARFGYMTMNEMNQDAYTRDELVMILQNYRFNVTILPEEPNTALGNYIIIFKK